MCHTVHTDPHMGMSQLEPGSLLFGSQLSAGQTVDIFDLWANNYRKRS
jgi:hypothetical protein